MSMGCARKLIAAVVAATGLVSAVAVHAEDGCRDTVERIVDAATAEWPLSEPYWLEPDWVDYFILGYNAQPDHGDDLIADRVIVFPVKDGYDFVFAFVDGCMSMYADLSSTKTYHLMELGYALAKGH